MRPLKLLSCDATDAAYTAAALLTGATPRFETALLVGTDTRAFAKSLAAYLPHLQWSVYAPNPAAVGLKLPFADQHADLVIGLDILALLPKAQRPLFFRELARVAHRELLAVEPLGTDLQLLIDRSLSHLYHNLFRDVHPDLARLVDYGLPNPQDAFSWLRHGEDADLFYAGDVAAYQAAAEHIIRRAHVGWLRSILLSLAKPALLESDASLREPETVPRRRHRRMFVFLRRA